MDIMKNFAFKNIIIFSLVALMATSCIIVKEKGEAVSDIEPMAILSPKPEIAMSETLVRSQRGDMLSSIPSGWFFVDVQERLSPDVIAVIVNPDYTLSAVFSAIKHNELFDSEFEKDSLFGIARASFAKRERKTAGALKLIGKYQNLQLGSKQFVKYEFSNTGGALSGRAAVFVSSIGEFYEFSLVPLEVAGKSIPDAREFDKIFRSFLASVQY